MNTIIPRTNPDCVSQVVIGEVDSKLEEQEDLTTIRADPLPELVH